LASCYVHICYINVVGYVINKRILQEASSLDGRINFSCKGRRLGC